MTWYTGFDSAPKCRIMNVVATGEGNSLDIIYNILGRMVILVTVILPIQVDHLDIRLVRCVSG